MDHRRTVVVIDVGSNSVRMLVARGHTDSAFEVVDEERFDARLGEGQEHGDLTADGIDRGIRALRIMGGIARSYEPDTVVAVGTEALRRANNAPDFIERARREADIDVRILSGYEEAYAGFLGVVNSTLFTEGHLLDIGGGSLEFMQVADRELVSAQSAPLGAIYSRERHLKSDPPTQREIRSLRKAVRQNLDVTQQHAALYATGGAVRNLARIVRLKRSYPLGRLHGLELKRRDVHRLATQLAKVSTEDRRKLAGVGSNRADILHAAAIVIDETMDIAGAQTLYVAGQGLREGLVWQELRGDSPVLPDVRHASIVGLARANGVDEMAAEPVVQTSRVLFEASRELHGLDAEDGELLVAAARLSGIGMHVDYYNRDRHAEYLVHSGDLHGFSHREVALLGALVRWSNTGTPDLKPYTPILRPDDARRATVLAVLLGVARAIRRRTPSPVERVEARIKKGTFEVTLVGDQSLEPETYQLERQEKRFEAVMKAPLMVRARVQDPVLA